MAKSIDKGPTTRQRIVQLATRRFAGQGYAGTSVEGLLDELGISRGALYHHFRAKEELFEAVLEAIEAELAQGVVTAVRGVADPVDRLRAGCAAWLRLAQDAAIRQVVLIDAPAVLGWEKWRQIDGRHGFGLLKNALEAAAKEGAVQAELIDVLSHMLLAALMEAALVTARAKKSPAAMRAAKAAIDRLLDGIFSRRPSQ